MDEKLRRDEFARSRNEVAEERSSGDDQCLALDMTAVNPHNSQCETRERTCWNESSSGLHFLIRGLEVVATATGRSSNLWPAFRAASASSSPVSTRYAPRVAASSSRRTRLFRRQFSRAARLAVSEVAPFEFNYFAQIRVRLKKCARQGTSRSLA